jgi:hypothetical protein
MMILYVICACEAIGDITATCDGKSNRAIEVWVLSIAV